VVIPVKVRFRPALLDSERLTFKNNCVKSNETDPCYQRQNEM